MSEIPEHDVRAQAEHALELVKLEKDPETVEHLIRVLKMIEDFKQLNLEGVEPMVSPVPAPTPLRPDQPGQTLSRSEALSDAPDTQAGFFRTPRP